MGFKAADIPARSPQVEQFIASFLSAVCDSRRRHILECLSSPDKEQVPPCERSVGEIARHLGLSYATTSEHLKQLSARHLLTSRKDGKKIYYCLRNRELVWAFHDVIHSLESHYQRDILPPMTEE